MSQPQHIHDQPFPPGTLPLVAILLSFVFLSAVAVRAGFMPVSASPVLLRQSEHLKPVVVRNLSFVDQKSGGVQIIDIDRQIVVETIIPGTPSGFIRGVMRGLARERRMHHVGPAAPFRLESWPDGELSLTDLSTKRTIELTAFGPTNRASFAKLLK